MKAGSVHIEIRGDDKKLPGDLQKAHQKIETTAKKMESRFITMGNVMKLALVAGAAAIIYQLTQIAKASNLAFKEYDTAVTDMGKITDETAEKIKSKIESIDVKYGDATEATKAYYNVISAGVTEPVAAMETLITSLGTAKAAHMDSATAVAGITSLMEAYGDKIDGARESADLLFQIEASGKTTVAELIPYIGELAGKSAALRITQDELGAAFSQVTLLAGSTSNAATQYKAVLTSLMAPTTDMSELLKEYGGAQQAIKDLGFAGVLKLIADASGGSAAELKKLLGSAEATGGMLTLLNNDMEGYTGRLDDMSGKTGLAKKAFNEWSESMEGVKAAYDASVKNVLIAIGEKLAPTIKEVTQITGEWLDKNKELIATNVEDWINTFLNGLANFIEGIAGTVESLYGLKAAVHEGISFLAAMGAALTDVAAALALLDPINAVKASIYGFRETFPVLAEMRDKFDALGESQAQSAQEAENSKAKFAGYADKIKETADKVRELVTEQDGMPSSSKSMAEGISSASGISVEAFKSMSDAMGKSAEYIDGKWVAIKGTLETPVPVKIDDQATEPLKSIQLQAETMQGAVEKSISVSVNDQATTVLQGIQAEIAKIKDKTVTVTVNSVFTGTGSSTKSLSEKVVEMETLIKGYEKKATEASPTINTNFVSNSDGKSVSTSDAIRATESLWGEVGWKLEKDMIPVLSVNNEPALTAIQAAITAYESFVQNAVRGGTRYAADSFEWLETQLKYRREALEREVKFLQKYYDNNPLMIVTNFVGKGSATLPLSDKIKEMTSKIGGFRDMVDNQTMQVTADYSQITDATVAVEKLLGAHRGISIDLSANAPLPPYHPNYVPRDSGVRLKAPLPPYHANYNKQETTNIKTISPQYNITFAPTVMTGDKAAMRRAAIAFRDELKTLNHRWT